MLFFLEKKTSPVWSNAKQFLISQFRHIENRRSVRVSKNEEDLWSFVLYVLYVCVPETWCYNTHPWSWSSMELANNGNSQEWSRFVSDYDFPHDSTFDSILSLLACKVKCFNCSFCDILTDRACCLHNNKLAPILAAVIRGSVCRSQPRYQCTMHGRIFPPIFSDHSFFFKQKNISCATYIWYLA